MEVRWYGATKTGTSEVGSIWEFLNFKITRVVVTWTTARVIFVSLNSVVEDVFLSEGERWRISCLPQRGQRSGWPITGMLACCTAVALFTITADWRKVCLTPAHSCPHNFSFSFFIMIANHSGQLRTKRIIQMGMWVRISKPPRLWTKANTSQADVMSTETFSWTTWTDYH